jgi:GNAT superfamily N-acetyltransferase
VGVRAPPTASCFDAERIEEAGLNALQTRRQLFYDGWLLRLSPGKAKRARSVNPHFGSTQPLEAKIAHCERLYAAHELPVLFRITPFAKPAELDRELAAQGYVAFDETLVQAVALDPAVPAPGLPANVALSDPDLAAFVDIVGDLRGSTPPQRDAHRERLRDALLPSRLVAVRAGGLVVCAGQIAVDGDLAGVFDLVTADDARGMGYATLACAALLAWAAERGARAAYLQVDAGNAPAIAVYRKFGFATVYTYHYCGRPGACR